MSVLPFVLAAMALLSPGKDHAELATAIATVVEAERPLFADDEDRRRTAAIVVAVAFRESSFRNKVISKTHDACALQVHGRPDLAADPVACIRVGLGMLRQSFKSCADYPVAFYASGSGACSNPRAQRISRDRFALAKRLLAEVQQ